MGLIFVFKKMFSSKADLQLEPDKRNFYSRLEASVLIIPDYLGFTFTKQMFVMSI